MHEYEIELRVGESHTLPLGDGRTARLVYLGENREGRPSIGIDAPEGVLILRGELYARAEV